MATDPPRPAPPADPPAGAADLRHRLRAAGATDEEIDAALRDDAVVELAGDVALRPAGARTSLRAVADAAGMGVERAQHLCTTAGLRADDVDALDWFESDVDWLRAVDGAGDLFGEGAVLALLRRAGAAMAQLAHASSAAFRVNVVAPAPKDRSTPMELLDRNLGTRDLVQVYIDTFAQLFRHHVRTTTREESVAAGDHGELRFMCVGFVDLASSTELGARVTAAELARVIADFEAAAFAAATRNRARVVKTIGDEVMLAAEEPAAVCRAALDIVDWCRRHDTLSSARGGVAAGELLEQDGDCYGPVVNRAARFVHAAADGTVVVDDEVRTRLDPSFDTERLPPVEHRGLGEIPWSTVR